MLYDDGNFYHFCDLDSSKAVEVEEKKVERRKDLCSIMAIIDVMVIVIDCNFNISWSRFSEGRWDRGEKLNEGGGSWSRITIDRWILTFLLHIWSEWRRKNIDSWLNRFDEIFFISILRFFIFLQRVIIALSRCHLYPRRRRLLYLVDNVVLLGGCFFTVSSLSRIYIFADISSISLKDCDKIVAFFQRFNLIF